jgi:hypothetical protein
VLLPHRHLMRAGTPVLPAFAGLIVAHDQDTPAVHGVCEPQAVQEAQVGPGAGGLVGGGIEGASGERTLRGGETVR